eukprot:CAMPEP_0196187664 /NCGR_PEP_ID=MMETSP0911-20130528/40828_1 /TAXON_ID=49265 /ORGANISM="Thalassiosira rotula, Strain GSO102" /LENGTH=46 /DNA_ID= /DNA_START= /DNA_END= /DNA_ORIENTATION=
MHMSFPSTSFTDNSSVVLLLVTDDFKLDVLETWRFRPWDEDFLFNK